VTAKRNQRHFLCMSIALCGCVLLPAHAQKQPLAELLNWQPRSNNICYGVFIEPAEVANKAAPKNLDQAPMNITADNPTQLSLNGQSTLSGNVTIKQPGRLLLADKASFNRDAATQTINRIELNGNVRYYEQHQELAGQRVLITPTQQAINLWDGAYRMRRDYTPLPLSAWGTAQHAEHHPQKLSIQQATYSTCPLCPAPLWQLHANSLDLDQNAGTGVAKHVSLYVKQVPILYWPYLSFSIDKRRKSGFLLPTPGHNPQDGFILEVPYYLNLATNYDAQITPTWYSNRGLQLNGSLRYLTSNSHGRFGASYLYHDQAFADMQAEELESPDRDSVNQQYLKRLENASENRNQFSLQHFTKLSPHLSAAATLNYVSDDYYLQDFGHGPIDKNSDQLLNQADFRYADNHWDFLSRLQIHQTMHPLNSSAIDPYRRLPQLDLRGDWVYGQNRPHTWISSEFISFDHTRDFLNHNNVVTGQRLDLSPGLELPIKNPYAYFTPSINIEGTIYWLQNQPPESAQNILRVLPITTIDTGLFFERDHNFGAHHYTQTLEPRMYYVYIPYTNQNQIPLFDTDLPTFTYQQLFTPNRFSGYDRVNDANQLTVALSSRFLDKASGNEHFSAIVATQVYFHDREVCTTPNCEGDPLADNHVSPLIGAVNYHFYNPWYATANVVWDPSDQRMTTANFYLHFLGENNRLLSAGYDYVRKGDEKVGTNSDLSRIDIAATVPLNERWQVITDWNYNVSHNHPQFILGGLEYQSCCFALRAIASRSLIDQTLTTDNDYDNRYYIQIDLKGLSKGISTSNPSSILSDRLPGFHDFF
jgi:LPS-assembly protein